MTLRCDKPECLFPLANCILYFAYGLFTSCYSAPRTRSPAVPSSETPIYFILLDFVKLEPRRGPADCTGILVPSAPFILSPRRSLASLSTSLSILIFSQVHCVAMSGNGPLSNCPTATLTLGCILRLRHCATVATKDSGFLYTPPQG